MFYYEELDEPKTDNVIFEKYEELLEKSHGLLKYTYRMGWDVDTGKRVVVKFLLNSKKVTRHTDQNLMKNVISTIPGGKETKVDPKKVIQKGVKRVTDKDYTVRGSTALLDAVGRTIKKIRDAQKHTAEEYRAEKVLFVIITYGHENASREYSVNRVKMRIERQKKKHGWEFMFLGANMDAIMEAGKLGIAADRAQNYTADSKGTQTAWFGINGFSTKFRTGS